MTTLPPDLRALGDDLGRAASRRTRRRRHVVLAWAAVVAIGAGAGVALGAASLLGRAAPRGAQNDLRRAVGYAMVAAPALRARTARVVATAHAATLYSVADTRGNYCAELIGTSHGVIYGFACGLARRASNGQLLADATATGVSYLDAPDGTSPPVVQFGRLPRGTDSARAVYDNGVTETISAGLDRFFVYQPSPRTQPLARRMPVTLQFANDHRTVWSYYLEPPQPLTLDDGGRQISGRVVIDGASQVELDVAPRAGAAPARTFVPLHADGTFSWRSRPGNVVYRLTVRDARGRPVSADTGLLTPKVVHAVAALAR